MPYQIFLYNNCQYHKKIIKEFEVNVPNSEKYIYSYKYKTAFHFLTISQSKLIAFKNIKMNNKDVINTSQKIHKMKFNF